MRKWEAGLCVTGDGNAFVYVLTITEVLSEAVITQLNVPFMLSQIARSFQCSSLVPEPHRSHGTTWTLEGSSLTWPLTDSTVAKDRSQLKCHCVGLGWDKRICSVLTMCQKLFICYITLPSQNAMKWLLLYPLYRWGKQGV